MFKLSQETIAIVTVGLALAGLDITSDNAIRSEIQAIRAEARTTAKPSGPRLAPTAPMPRPPVKPTAKPSSSTSPA